MSETKTLQYRTDGPADAPVLVLGPALGTTWHMWDRQIPELSRQWRVLRFDLPGHGGAPAHAATSVPELAERLLATLDRLGVVSFGYAGCSTGGAIGIELALRRPQRLASLALLSAAGRFGTPDEYRQRGVVVRSNGLEPMARALPDRWFTPAFAASQPAILEWAVQMMRTTDPGCYIGACEALASFDARGELSGVRVPTLVVAGSEDRVTPPAEARQLVAGIPDARLALIPAASHLAPVEQPAAVTDLLVRHFGTSWQTTTGHTGGIPVTSPDRPQVPAQSAPAAPFAELAAAGEQPEALAVRTEYEAGMKVRREVLGDAHVDRETEETDEFTAEFDALLTRSTWGGVWTRPGIDRRMRSVVAITALVAGGHVDELAAHTRAALRTGLTPAEIREVLLQTAVYCGMPAAAAAFRIAQEVIQEETTPHE